MCDTERCVLRCVIFMDRRRRFWHILDPPPERAHCAPLLRLRAPLSPTSRRVQDTRASSTTRRLVPRCVFCTPPGLAPVARLDRRRARALVGAPRSRARNPAVCEAVTPLRRAVARGGDDRTAETRAIGVSARAFFFPNHRRASSDPARVPTPIADSSARRASGGFIPSANMGGSAGGFDTTKVWSPRAAGSRTRSTGRGTRCSGSRSLAWRAPPSSTTAGRWSRGRSRPPAGSPARRGAPTSPREARRSRGRHRQS